MSSKARWWTDVGTVSSLKSGRRASVGWMRFKQAVARVG